MNKIILKLRLALKQHLCHHDWEYIEQFHPYKEAWYECKHCKLQRTIEG